MSNDPSIIEHDRLNAAFSSGSVLTTQRKELERLLLAAAECKSVGEENTKRNSRRADILRHLLQVRISEEFQRKTFRMSVAALIVSVCALLFTGYRLWHDVSREAATPIQSTPVQVISHEEKKTPNKAPEPTPGAVTPRATEGTSK